jgi:hypothetical protein
MSPETVFNLHLVLGYVAWLLGTATTKLVNVGTIVARARRGDARSRNSRGRTTGLPVPKLVG